MALEDFLDEFGDVARASQYGPGPRSLTSKVIEGGARVLGGPADFVTRRAFLPLAQRFTDDPLIQVRLRNLAAEEDPIFLGDVASATGFLRTEEDAGLGERIAKGAGRFALDVVGDPLTFVGLGSVTRLGKTAKAISAAKRAKQSVKLSSKVAKAASELKGAKPSANLIRTFDEDLGKAPLPEQIRKGQRSLISAEIPFTDINVPLLGGEIGARIAEPFSAVRRSALVMKAASEARKLLSNRTGLAEYDRLYNQYVDVLNHRTGQEVLEGTVYDSKVEDLSKTLNIPREQLVAEITEIAERMKQGVPSGGPLIKKGAKKPKVNMADEGGFIGDKPREFPKKLSILKNLPTVTKESILHEAAEDPERLISLAKVAQEGIDEYLRIEAELGKEAARKWFQDLKSFAPSQDLSTDPMLGALEEGIKSVDINNPMWMKYHAVNDFLGAKQASPKSPFAKKLPARTKLVDEMITEFNDLVESGEYHQVASEMLREEFIRRLEDLDRPMGKKLPGAKILKFPKLGEEGFIGDSPKKGMSRREFFSKSFKALSKQPAENALKALLRTQTGGIDPELLVKHMLLGADDDSIGISSNIIRAFARGEFTKDHLKEYGRFLSDIALEFGDKDNVLGEIADILSSGKALSPKLVLTLNEQLSKNLVDPWFKEQTKYIKEFYDLNLTRSSPPHQTDEDTLKLFQEVMDRGLLKESDVEPGFIESMKAFLSQSNPSKLGKSPSTKYKTPKYALTTNPPEAFSEGKRIPKFPNLKSEEGRLGEKGKKANLQSLLKAIEPEEEDVIDYTTKHFMRMMEKGGKNVPAALVKMVADDRLPVRGKHYSATQSLPELIKKPKGVPFMDNDFPFAITNEGHLLIGRGSHAEDLGLIGNEYHQDVIRGRVRGLGRITIDDTGMVKNVNGDIEIGAGFLIGDGEEELMRGLKEFGVKLHPDAVIPISRTMTLAEAKAGKVTDFIKALKDIGDSAYTPPIKSGLDESGALTLSGSVDPVHQQMMKEALAREFQEREARRLMIEMTSPISIVRPLLSDGSYLPHITTKEAWELVRKKWLSEGKLSPKYVNKRDFNTQMANALRRELVTVKPDVVDKMVTDGVFDAKVARRLKSKKGLEVMDQLVDDGVITEKQYAEMVHALTVKEVNEMAQRGELEFLGKGTKVDKFFEEDPVYSTTIRGVRGEKARTSAEFFEEIKLRGIAVPLDQATEGMVPMTMKGFEGYAAPIEVVRHLNGWDRMVKNPMELNGFIRMYDKLQDTWKSWTLAIFPSYHLRNVVGNVFNNWLAGINTPKPYLDAYRIQRKKSFSMVDGLGKVWDQNSIYERAKELGVLDRGFVGSDIRRTLDEEISKGKWLSPGNQNKIVKFGFKYGKELENHQRLAHFIQKLRDGDTAEEAAQSVKKYLFDYGDLSDFEKSTMKRLFPFYTWTRKNVPLQLQHLITEPAKMGAIYKLHHEAGQGVPSPNENYLPEWMKENLPARIRFNKDLKKYEYFVMGSWLPALDIAKVVSIHRMAAQMLGPFPKELLQQWYNVDFATQQKIERIPGEKTRFFNNQVPTRVVHGAKVVRLLNEIDKLMTPETDVLNKIHGILTGRTYQVDEENMFISNKIKVDDEIDELRAAIRREGRKTKPNEAEINRIVDMIQRKAREY